MAKEPKPKRICKCECGGTVRGVEQFDRLFTWCEKCSPVTVIDFHDLVKTDPRLYNQFT